MVRPMEAAPLKITVDVPRDAVNKLAAGKAGPPQKDAAAAPSAPSASPPSAPAAPAPKAAEAALLPVAVSIRAKAAMWRTSAG